jgi:FlaA1/EpsC-like NDP-sugar epimerase
MYKSDSSCMQLIVTTVLKKYTQHHQQNKQSLQQCQMPATTPFGATTTAIEVAQAYSSHIAGKTILITGTTLNSIGSATAQALAHGGASTIILIGRSSIKLSSTIDTLSAAYPKTTFIPLALDLNSQKAVQKAAQDFLMTRGFHTSTSSSPTQD